MDWNVLQSWAENFTAFFLVCNFFNFFAPQGCNVGLLFSLVCDVTKSGYHPHWDDLAKFGYRPDMKVEFFLRVVLATTSGVTVVEILEISYSFFFEIWWIMAMFSKKIKLLCWNHNFQVDKLGIICLSTQIVAFITFIVIYFPVLGEPTPSLVPWLKLKTLNLHT